jgi:hypothetical protein
MRTALWGHDDRTFCTRRHFCRDATSSWRVVAGVRSVEPVYYLLRDVQNSS